MSYNSGRMPPKASSADSSHPPSNSGIPNASRFQRSPLARPVNSTPRGRASSFSSAEGSRQIPAPAPSNNRSKRLSLLPRPSTGGLTFQIPPSTPSPQTPVQPIPPSVSTLDITNPSAFVPIRPSYQAKPPPAKRTRNVLRRKAPLIGKHVEQSQAQKLSLVIPQESQPNEMKDPRLHSTPDAYSAGPSASASSQSSSDKTPKSAMETPKTGPAELASLRTVNTQNLPPTHSFPSASSPSTRYSESPGMWSRGSTPTSLSSYSPGLMHSSKIGRLRQPSPSHTRLPFFSPPSSHASPQSAQSDRREPKTHRTALPQRSLGPSPVASTAPKQIPKPVATKTPGPPHSPPPRKSSVNFSPKDSPSKDSDIDVEKARKEVEEAERELFNVHKRRIVNPTALEASVPKTPPRPSRDGTHRLNLETSPVIQSNLPYLKTTGHKRRESMERALTAAQPYPTANPSAATSVDTFRSKDISRIPSREAGSPVMTRKSPKLVKDPPKVATKENSEPKKPITPKRFGLFPKKSKPEMESNTGEQNRPPVRKGPVAGTGHEGYGKYSQRGRKASASSSSGARTRSTSTTRSAPRSIASSKGSMSSRPDLELDDFLSSRLEPVIISGGGSTLSRTQSEQSMSSLSVASSSLHRPTPLTVSTVQSTDSLVTTSTDILNEAKLPTASSTTLSSARSQSLERKPEVTDRPQPPKSRMPVAKGKKREVYINPEAGQTQTSLSSAASTTLPVQIPKSTAGSSNQQQPATTKESQQVNKKEKNSRWNLFQRNRSEPPKAPAPEPTSVSHTAQLHAAISPAPKTRPVAHYALVDADSDELDDIINNIEHSPPTEEEIFVPAVEVPASLNIRKRHPSVLLPSPPKMHGEFEKEGHSSPKTAMFNRNLMDLDSESSPEDRRPRRLASVGRIPKVVSRRDRQHTPATRSFSRPFSVVESPPSVPAYRQQGPHDYPSFTDSPWKQQADIPSSQPPDWGYNYTQGFSAPATVSALNFLAGPYSAHEFIHFSPQKSSPSSSSPLEAVTAVVPKPETAPMEDEIWKEYDDLIDVLSPDESKPDEPNKPEDDERFQFATMASRALQDELNNPNSLHPGPSASGEASIRSSSDSVRLRRSRIASALHYSLSPSTQPSYSNLIASYGENEEPRSPEHPVQSPQGKFQEQQSTFLQSLAAASSPEPKSRDDRKSIPGSSERAWDAVTRTNMRSASLMTSRWLSFGRVLFSPAHNHVKTGTHGRILVIDGLGNDDWSFYCSLTYPDAEVYSLSGRPVSTAMPHPAAWQPPTNHHTVYHAGLQNPLPFPKDYFAATVLRFPAASPEAMQNNIIQECKRVLRAGGYLEMSLLDRDMVNMGPRTRKAVRRLKEMTCLANPAISLKPSSDNVQRLLGTQGFDNLRRCMVRIPVAGMVVRSSDSTTSSSNKSFLATATTSSTGFSLPAISVTGTTGSQSTRTASKSSPSDDTSVSLGDLLSDPSPSAANDESIAKIVARVGRWWYTKCYEDPVLPDTGDNDPGMWNDRKVLRECQQRGTGFRMLIAYAQKPSEVKRRTASV
ncbi:uncharacterized protein N7484_004483 [Penicillium longicatenatum]|uniref:uncharacterized protein n=1 Tax=Penicillium longicatenatum TaxID=1561947 RepID=UPI0025496D14|nr:uncharacterized protein N7484_004483 [Penicillium longicatenatum]KAJ5650760.1 hypothetical protein N7484_004483 [Penicillium longicatenatum]